MPSWIKEHDGLEWYDTTYTTKQTNQSPEQLHKKVAKGTLRCLKDAQGIPRWFARPDVEKLREAFLKRRKNALTWKPSDSQLEARHTRRWSADIDHELKARATSGPSGPGRVGPVAAHYERVMIAETRAPKKDKQED